MKNYKKKKRRNLELERRCIKNDNLFDDVSLRDKNILLKFLFFNIQLFAIKNFK